MDTTEPTLPVADIKVPERTPATRLETGSFVAPIVPRNVQEVAMVADAVIRAKLAPECYTKESGRELPDAEAKSRIMIGIMKGAEVGFPPITALSTIAIINGRPTIWGDGAVALCQRDGELADQETIWEGADMARVCTVRMWRRGQAKHYEGKFSMRDAERAKLINNPKRPTWMLYPDRMLFSRARAYAIRDGFADKLCGLHIREEIEDLPPPPPEKTDTRFLDDGKTIEGESFNVWACPEGVDFETWFRVQVGEIVVTTADIDALVEANRGRMNDECHMIAGKQKAELEKTA